MSASLQYAAADRYTINLAETGLYVLKGCVCVHCNNGESAGSEERSMETLYAATLCSIAIIARIPTEKMTGKRIGRAGAVAWGGKSHHCLQRVVWWSGPSSGTAVI